ncbi:MAG: hypothetical protein MUC62_00320 [Candidatus Thermoplasmatota archaeon]|jgi:uncharacterized coiled-coil DUF342 family protein|nr:hypothetical protein [Candidatus Thermoplasmatota archaeon]
MQNFEIAQKIREIRERISELREEEDILNLKVQNKIREVEATRERRDQLNLQVRELSSKPREILEKRKEAWDNISGTNDERRRIFRDMQPYLHRIGELRKIRDAFNAASRGTMERLLANLSSTRQDLLSSDLSLKNELYMFDLLFELRDRVLVKLEADKVHKEIVRVKEVDLAKYNHFLAEIEGRIGDMKNLSHEGLMTAKEIWSRRDEVREQSQKEHRAFLDGQKEISHLRKKWYDKRREIQDLYREIDQWNAEFKKSPTERRQSDMSRKQAEAVEKFKRGEKLSLEELSLVVESGQMK